MKIHFHCCVIITNIIFHSSANEYKYDISNLYIYETASEKNKMSSQVFILSLYLN